LKVDITNGFNRNHVYDMFMISTSEMRVDHIILIVDKPHSIRSHTSQDVDKLIKKISVITKSKIAQFEGKNKSMIQI